jgi:cation diffusion facilitator family transporter
MQSDRRHSLSSAAVNAGLAANVILAALKTFIGVFGHSAALLADGINSTSDVAYYIVVKVFMNFARKPADREHPYGHSQLETISALVVGSFVITTAVAIFWDSINTAFDLLSGGASAGATSATLWVALLTIAAKIALTVFTKKIGRQTGNPAVLALASDHRNDIFSASGAAVGIFLSRTGHPWVDPLAGALVALVVLKTGIEILRNSALELMDAVPTQELSDQIRGLLANVPDIMEVEEVHAHRFGPYLVVNITIAIDGALTVTDGDRIATEAETRLCREIELLRQVYVHYHPKRNQPAPVA